jgi:hypothetical protein
MFSIREFIHGNRHCLQTFKAVISGAAVEYDRGRKVVYLLKRTHQNASYRMNLLLLFVKMISPKVFLCLAVSTLLCFANGSRTSSAALISVPNFGANPTNLQMSIYVPAKLATDPAIILAVSE